MGTIVSMNRFFLYPVVFFNLVSLGLLPGANNPAFANSAKINITGQAMIVDGDTLKIGTHKIRLYGIDAPEKKQTCKLKGQDWDCGKDASLYLQQLIMGSNLTCLIKSKDRYKRMIGICEREDGLILNQEMVASGMAVAYLQYSKAYQSDQLKAQSQMVGLWASEFIMPDIFRKHK